MPEPVSNDPNGEPTFISRQGDSGVNESLQETFIAGPEISPTDGTTRLGTSDEMYSFSDYESADTLSQAATLNQIGEYQITKILGRGGMGIVYRARHRTLRRDVAIKMMLAGAQATPDQAQRFLTEARAVAHLQHPNIVQIFEVGEHDHMPYFTLELVDGQSLDQQLKNKTLSERDAATLMQTLCLALQYAHEQGILHRDLKPANILMTIDGRPKVTDFGLARKVEDDTQDSSRTREGTVIGTPSFMSPEQARGDVHLLTHATDQYSLGATLYKILTGRPPFIGARAVDTVLQVIRNEPIAPRTLQPKLSVDIETICLKAMQKDVAKRYASCAEMGEDLGRFLRGEPILARPVGRVERISRWCKRNPVVASLSALAISALIAVAGISTWSALTLRSKNAELTQAATNLELKNTALTLSGKKLESTNVELTKRTERLLRFTATLYSDLREFNVDEGPRVKPLRDQLLNSFSDIMLQVVDELPKAGDAEPVLAAIMMGLVDSMIDQQRGDEAEPLLEELREIYERRVKLKQGSDAARNNQALRLLLVGNFKRDLKRDLPASIEAQQQALKIAQDIVDHPKAADDGKGRLPVYEAKRLLADTHHDLGVTWHRLGDPRQALSDSDMAIKLREQVISDFEQDPEFAEWPAEDKAIEREPLLGELKKTKLALAAAQFRAGQTAAAEPQFKESYETSRALLIADPKNPKLRHEFVGQAEMWAEFLGYSNRGPEGLVVLEEAEKYLDDLLADDPYGVAFRRTVTVALYRLSQWRKELGQGDFETPLRLCLEIRRTLAGNERNNDRRQLDLMLALARSGQSADALAIANKYLAGTNPDNEMLMEIARAFSQCASFAATDADRATLETKAVNTINQAIGAKFKDSVFLNGELDLKPIRGRWSL